MSLTGPAIMPIAQPGGLYPAAPPRIKKPSKGSKIKDSRFKIQKKTRFQKRPELPPISYHITPYDNPDNPPMYKRRGGRFYKIESEEDMPFKNVPDKANRIYEDAYNSAKKRGLSDKRAAKSGWGAVKNAGYVKKAGRWVKGSAATPSKREDAPKTPPKGYPEKREKYADPTNYKYPIDTEEHVRAAWSYINKPKNAGKYSSSELATMKARIKRAAKKFGVEISEDRTEDQTPHEQDHLGPMQPHEPLMRMTTPNHDWQESAGREQRPHDYKSPFPGRDYSSTFPSRDPGPHSNPADQSLTELLKRERKAHPNLSEEELEELVKLHVRELGPPSDREHQENYKETHGSVNERDRMLRRRQRASALHFGVDTGIPISHRFKATPLGDGGDIKLIGTFLDYETTTNGWHIDPEEETNIVAAPTRANVTVRVAHSKEPERVVGKYTKFQANEDDGCTDAYGKSLSRHIDFEAVVNPQDPQLRTNILKGWVNDISPGLDAEVFCGECGEPWGLDQATNKLMKTCEHQDAEGVLRNIKPKEGSIVTEPAFEGRTQFHPTFTFGMAMNELFSPESYESEPPASRLKGHASYDGRPTIKGGTNMSNHSERKEGTDAKTIATRLYGFFTAQERKRLDKMHFWKAEDEDKGEDEDEDEDARIRAAMPLIKKAMSRAASYTKMLKSLNPPDQDDDQERTEDEDEDEDQHKYAEDRSEDEDEDRMEDTIPEQEGVDTPGEPTRTKHPGKVPVNYAAEDEDEDRAEDEDQQPVGPGQLKSLKGMKLSGEERRTIARAERIILADKKKQVLSHANTVLAMQEKRSMLRELERARKLFEAQKDTAGIKAADEQIQKLKGELAPQIATYVTGAQVPTSNPTILAADKYGSTQIVTGPHGEKLEVKATAVRPTVNADTFAAAFNASLLPALKATPRLATVSEDAWSRQGRRMQ